MIEPAGNSGLLCYHRTMGIRDREIVRCATYALQHDMDVKWKPYRPGMPSATWDPDGNKLTVAKWHGKSKTETILDLVHEFAHHRAWLKNGKVTDKIYEDALDADNNNRATEEDNYLLLQLERNDAKYQLRIFRELKLKIPLYKFFAHRRLALWIYKVNWKTGQMPTEKAIAQKKRDLYIQCRRFS